MAAHNEVWALRLHVEQSPPADKCAPLSLLSRRLFSPSFSYFTSLNTALLTMAKGAIGEVHNHLNRGGNHDFSVVDGFVKPSSPPVLSSSAGGMSLFLFSHFSSFSSTYVHIGRSKSLFTEERSANMLSLTFDSFGRSIGAVPAMTLTLPRYPPSPLSSFLSPVFFLLLLLLLV